MAKGIDYEIYLILRVHEDKNSKKKPYFSQRSEIVILNRSNHRY